MNVLLVAATHQEIEPFLTRFCIREGENILGQHQLTICITGVGMVAAAFSLGNMLATTAFDFAVNAGIAGAFTKQINLGEVVAVTQDCLAEFGAEDANHFISMDDLGFGQSTFTPIAFNLSFLQSTLQTLYFAKAITVNKVHGNAQSIQQISERLHPEVESMEGAAFFYACNQVNLPSVQLRSISNYVEPRNRESWNIPLAVKNLNEVLIAIFDQLKLCNV